MKKIIIALVTLSFLISSCGKEFSSRRYTKFRHHKHSTVDPAINPYTVVEKIEAATITHNSTPLAVNPLFEKCETPQPDTGKKEEQKTKLGTSKPRDAVSSNGITSNKSENGIRHQGKISVLLGVISIAVVATAAYYLFTIGSLIFLGLFILGGLLAYLGMQTSIGAKRDLDLISDRSTKKKIERPATIGFILNLIPFCLTLLVVLLFLISLV